MKLFKIYIDNKLIWKEKATSYKKRESFTFELVNG